MIWSFKLCIYQMLRDAVSGNWETKWEGSSMALPSNEITIEKKDLYVILRKISEESAFA